LPKRTRIISHQRQKVIEQIAALQETLDILDLKLSRAAEVAKDIPRRRAGLQIVKGGKR
jgi:hypothetical protein